MPTTTRTLAKGYASAFHRGHGYGHGYSVERDGEGEGSRGGHIIGHTRSGKPIYLKGHNRQSWAADHKGWTKADHAYCFNKHRQLQKEADDIDDIDGRNYHRDMALAHASARDRQHDDAADYAHSAGRHWEKRERRDIHEEILRARRRELGLGHEGGSVHRPPEIVKPKQMSFMFKGGRVRFDDGFGGEVRFLVKARSEQVAKPDDEPDDEEDLEKGKHGGTHGKTPKESRQWDHVYESQRARGLSKEAAAASAWSAVKRSRGDGAMAKALPGVSLVRMSKAEAEVGIVALEPSMLTGFSPLSPPEVVPGTVLEDDKGNVIRGVFRIGPYQAEYIRLNGKLPYCTIAGPMPVPFTMIVKGWADAQAKAMKACDAFVKGQAAPEEGVFQHPGSKTAVKWPGVST